MVPHWTPSRSTAVHFFQRKGLRGMLTGTAVVVVTTGGVVEATEVTPAKLSVGLEEVEDDPPQAPKAMEETISPRRPEM